MVAKELSTMVKIKAWRKDCLIMLELAILRAALKKYPKEMLTAELKK